MSQFTFEVRNDIAWVTFDSGGMNTLSATSRTISNMISRPSCVAVMSRKTSSSAPAAS